MFLTIYTAGDHDAAVCGEITIASFLVTIKISCDLLLCNDVEMGNICRPPHFQHLVDKTCLLI